MKQKLGFATTITTTFLFVILASSKLPILFLSAFIILMSKGIKMFIDSTNDDIFINEEQPKENLVKLLIIRLVMQLIPIAFIIVCIYILLLRKEILLSIF